MKRLMIALVALVAMVACEAPPLREAKSANVGVSVSVMTEFDGIRLYSVKTGSATVYVAVTNADLKTAWDVDEGTDDAPSTVRYEVTTLTKR